MVSLLKVALVSLLKLLCNVSYFYLTYPKTHALLILTWKNLEVCYFLFRREISIWSAADS